MAWYNSNWAKRKLGTIDSDQVSANLTNFPVAVLITDSDLSASARSDGFDILFTDDDGTTKLDHEIEKYTSGTGVLVAWVEVPSVTSAVDKTIYMYYGHSGATDQSNPTGTWDTNHKAVYHFAEDPSGTAPQILDSTSNNNDATSEGSMTSGDLVAGKAGDGLDFDGSDDALTVPHSAELDIVGDVTISYWVEFDVVNVDQIIVDKIKTPGSDPTPFTAYMQDSGGTRYHTFYHHSTGGDYSSALTFAFASAASTSWTHVAFVRDATGETVDLYLNGTQAQQLTYSADDPEASADTMYIGSDTTSGRHLNGILDELRISNTQRSAAWIAAEYNSVQNAGTFLTFGAEEDFAVVVIPAVASAVASATNPNVQLGSIVQSPGAATAAASAIDPGIVLGDISLPVVSADAVSQAIDPDVILGSVSMSPAVATSAATAIDPMMVLGSLSITPPMANSVATAIDPLLILGSLSIAPLSANGVATAINPTVQAGGNVTVAPAAAAAASSAIDPSLVLGGLSIAPDPSSSTGSAIDPGLILGSISLIPQSADGIATAIDPALVLSSLVLSPGAAASVSVAVNPTVELGGQIIVTPAPAIASTLAVSPGINLSSITIPVSAASALAVAINPTVQAGASVVVTPSAAAALASAIDPILALGSIVATPVAATAISQAAIATVVQSSMVVSPSAAAASAVALDPTTLMTSLALAPTPAESISSALDPTLTLGSVLVSPAAASVIGVALDPTVLGGIVIPVSDVVLFQLDMATVVKFDLER